MGLRMWQGNAVVRQRDDLASLKPLCHKHLLATPSAPHNAPSSAAFGNPAENWQKLSFNSTEQLFCRRVLAGGPAQLTPLLGQGGEGPAVAAGQEVSVRMGYGRHLGCSALCAAHHLQAFNGCMHFLRSNAE